MKKWLRKEVLNIGNSKCQKKDIRIKNFDVDEFIKMSTANC